VSAVDVLLRFFPYCFYLPAVVLPGNHCEITIFYKITTKNKIKYRFVAYKLRPRGRLRTYPMRKHNICIYIMCGITGILCTTIRIIIVYLYNCCSSNGRLSAKLYTYIFIILASLQIDTQSIMLICRKAFSPSPLISTCFHLLCRYIHVIVIFLQLLRHPCGLRRTYSFIYPKLPPASLRSVC